MNYKKCLLLIILFLSLASNVQANTKEIVTFNKCVDGDTAIFNVNGDKLTVRFLAIDTPETVHQSKPVEPFGKEASDYTCSRIKNAKIIELEYDDGSSKLDKYNRGLAWIWVDDDLLQKELIERGLAKVAYLYGKYHHTETLKNSESVAKADKIGLWGNYVPVVYTVTFDEIDNIKEVKVEENQPVTSYIPQKKGFTFISWQNKKKDFDFTKPITADLTLTAVYEKKYTITDIIIILVVLLLLFLTNKKAFKKKLKKFI